MQTPIRLTVPPPIRFASMLVQIGGYWITLLFFPRDILLLGLILWTWFIIRGLFYSPEMTIYPDGIETRRLWWRHFTHWSDITYIRFGELNSQLYPKTIHPLVKYLLYNSLMINSWRENYKEAVALMKEQLEKKESLSQRAYE